MTTDLLQCFLRGERSYLHSPDIVAACLDSWILKSSQSAQEQDKQFIFTFLKPSISALELSTYQKSGATVRIDIRTKRENSRYFLYPTEKRLDFLREDSINCPVVYHSQGYILTSPGGVQLTLNLALMFGKEWYQLRGVSGQLWVRQICVSPLLLEEPQEIHGEVLRSRYPLDYWVYKNEKGKQLFSFLAAVPSDESLQK
jgi:hypothetical protein